MHYDHVEKGVFIDRPNRFIAHVKLNGICETVHVKNTGRCKELLLPGCSVYCARSDNPLRKTAYDLIAVEKPVFSAPPDLLPEENRCLPDFQADCQSVERPDTLLINMDSQAPNAAAREWLETKALFSDLTFLKPEYKYGNSRFDFYAEAGRRKIFIEVKGVTLEENGVAAFPDAPTERGVKHLQELSRCVREGFETYVLFVVQMERAKYFIPNRRTHPLFAEALAEAQKSGVTLLAYTCRVTPDSMALDRPLPIRL